MSHISVRFNNALAVSSSVEALRELAKALVREGMSNEELYALFDQQRVRYESDGKDVSYNAILDVMDEIVGFCSPHMRLF